MATVREQAALGDISLVVEDPLRDPKLTAPRTVKRHEKSGMLEWAPETEVSSNARGVLQKFVALHGLHDGAIGAFAKDYGVLGLTRLGQIEGSPGTRVGSQDLMEWNGTRGVFRERIAYWRPYIAALRYVTTAFTQLRVDPTVDPRSLLEDAGMPTVGTDNPVVTGTRELWASFGLGDPDFTVPVARWFTVNGPHCVAENLARVGSQDALKWLAYHVTNTWIPLGGIYVALASDGRRVQTVLHMGGIDQPGGMGIMPENSLRNVLVAQLLAQATKPSPDQLIACSNCGTYYEPLRAPIKGQLHYCPVCRPIIVREQKRQWAARNRQAKRAANEG